MSRPTPAQVKAAVAELTMLKFFPAEPIPRAAVMKLVARMVPSDEALNWLVSTMIDRVGAWHGPAELRAVLCTKFKPADGIEAWSTLPGFTAADSEAAYLAAIPAAKDHEQLSACDDQVALKQNDGVE